MQIYTIYKITNNLNDKSYIGFDSNYPNRIRDHKKGYLKITDKTCVFYKALKKYGWDNFSCSIVYQSKDKTHTLKIMENYFICEYRTYVGFNDCNGYNLTLGGEGTIGFIHSEDWKKNHSNMMRGRKFTKEHKTNISLALKGKPKSKEHTEKSRISNSGKNNWQIRRKEFAPHPRAKKYIGVSPNGLVYLDRKSTV